MDQKEIVIVERPAYVSWEKISAVLKEAHAENVKNGIVLPYPFLPPEDLYAKTEGRGGKMIIAMYNEEIVGTGAVAIIEKNLWCGKGKYAYCFLAAILPNYAGMGIYKKIEEEQEKYAKLCDVDRIMLDTDVRNNRMINISERNDYRKVEYRVREGHNSVVMVKWLNGCPYSRLKCAMKYNSIKIKKIIFSKYKQK